jgi:hypothetical protein
LAEPDEKELLRRLKEMTAEEAAEVAQPPGFEHEQVESGKDKPSINVEEVRAERIVVEGQEGDEGDGGLTEDFMSNVIRLLTEIHDDLRDGFQLDS